MTFTTW